MNTRKYAPDPDVQLLTAVIDYSRAHAEKFDYQRTLNEWQCKFVIYIHGLAKHVHEFTPTPKQKAKTLECLDAIRAGLLGSGAVQALREVA